MSAKKPSAVFHEAAKLLRRYAEIGHYRKGPSIGKGLAYLGEIREAVKWLEYVAPRADEVLGEPMSSEVGYLRRRDRQRDPSSRRGVPADGAARDSKVFQKRNTKDLREALEWAEAAVLRARRSGIEIPAVHFQFIREVKAEIQRRKASNDPGTRAQREKKLAGRARYVLLDETDRSILIDGRPVYFRTASAAWQFVRRQQALGRLGPDVRPVQPYALSGRRDIPTSNLQSYARDRQRHGRRFKRDTSGAITVEAQTYEFSSGGKTDIVKGKIQYVAPKRTESEKVWVVKQGGYVIAGASSKADAEKIAKELREAYAEGKGKWTRREAR